MKSKHIEVAVLATTTLIATTGAIWNSIDERDLLQGWSGVALTAGIWLAIPWLIALGGVLTRNPVTRRFNLLLSIFYASVYSLYALNASSSDEGEGAQHMHLILVPFLMFFVTLVMWSSVLLLRGVERIRASK